MIPTPAQTPEIKKEDVSTAPQTVSTIQEAAKSQHPENLTLNTASVLSKIGLYARVTFLDLWVMVLVTSGSITTLVADWSNKGPILVFLISALIITVPIFLIANGKRKKELLANPKLIDDIFLKKYLRKNLFLAIVATAISGFYTIWSVLSMVLLSNTSSSSDQGKMLIDSLVFTIGFGAILAFSWEQHARTTK